MTAAPLDHLTRDQAARAVAFTVAADTVSTLRQAGVEAGVADAFDVAEWLLDLESAPDFEEAVALMNDALLDMSDEEEGPDYDYGSLVLLRTHNNSGDPDWLAGLDHEGEDTLDLIDYDLTWDLTPMEDHPEANEWRVLRPEAVEAMGEFRSVTEFKPQVTEFRVGDVVRITKAIGSGSTSGHGYVMGEEVVIDIVEPYHGKTYYGTDGWYIEAHEAELVSRA